MNKSNGMSISKRVLSPEFAAQLLKTVINNRSISRLKIMQYANDISNGKWQDNGETIKIDKHGALMDGQHRCHAIVEADKPIEVYIAKGLEPSVFKTIDTGKTRNKADVLKISGEKDCTQLASALTFLWQHDNDCITRSHGGKAGSKKIYSPTNDEILKKLKEHPQMRGSLRYANSFRSDFPFVSINLVAALHYIITGFKPNKGKEFFDSFKFGLNLSSGDPVYTLRKRMVSARKAITSRLTKTETAAFIIKAWNAYCKGDKIHELRWRIGTDFPDIKI